MSERLADGRPARRRSRCGPRSTRPCARRVTRVAHDAGDVVARPGRCRPCPSCPWSPSCSPWSEVTTTHVSSHIPRSRRASQSRPSWASTSETIPKYWARIARMRGRVDRWRRRGQVPAERDGPVGPRDRIAHLVGVVGGGPRPGGRVGRMRPPVAGVGEPWPVLSAQPLEEAVGEEGRDAVLGRSLGLGGQGGVAVAELAVAELGQPVRARPPARRRARARRRGPAGALVVGEPRIVGAVGLLGGRWPGRRSRTAPAGSPARRAGPGQVVEAVVERRPVADHPVVHLVGAGVEAGASRAAGCRLAEMAGEPDTVSGELVEAGRAHDRMAGADRQSPRNWSRVMKRTFCISSAGCQGAPVRGMLLRAARARRASVARFWSTVESPRLTGAPSSEVPVTAAQRQASLAGNVERPGNGSCMVPVTPTSRLRPARPG